MELKILELSERSAKFILSNTTAAFANGIRRAMLADVKTLAVDEVDIYNNTSVLYDEQIALRLGLIPLVHDIDLIPYNECETPECSECQVSLTLSGEGPKTLYSKDLISSNPSVHPADDDIPIIELEKGHEISLEAIARMGYGRDHAKWQAGVACGYKYLTYITTDKSNLCSKCIEDCSEKLIHSIVKSIKISKEDLFDGTLCKSCESVCDMDKIEIKEDKRAFIMSIESDGSYSAKDLILAAGDVIKNKAIELQNLLHTI